MNENDILVFFDESSFLNEPYNSKSLYKRGTKHKNEANPYKFKANAIGSLTIKVTQASQLQIHQQLQKSQLH